MLEVNKINIYIFIYIYLYIYKFRNFLFLKKIGFIVLVKIAFLLNVLFKS